MPDKTEVKAFCGLTKKQAALYQEAVTELAKQLDRTDGIERRGTILAFLMRFKQICITRHNGSVMASGAKPTAACSCDGAA